MSTLVVIATSHGQDAHSGYPGYYNYETPEKGWVYYLGERAGFDRTVNLSQSALGIETYYTRVKHAIHNYSPDVMLMEVPSAIRFHLFLNEDVYEKYQYLNKDWTPDVAENRDGFAGKIRDYTMSIMVADDTKNIERSKKFEHVNSVNTDMPLTKEIYDNYYSTIPFLNRRFLNENVAIQCEMIDAYIKAQGITPIWFNFSSIDDNAKFGTQVLPGKIITKYIEKKFGWKKSNKEHYADGAHLNSDKWRILVDDLFVDILTRTDK